MTNNNLQQLEDAVRRDLDLLDYPRRDWVLPHTTTGGHPVLDCLIIGGGQGGLAVAWGLKRERVHNVLVVDANPPGFEGPWRTFGRMITLRTPKYLTGPDLGVPSLTIRAWYEAQHGENSWEELKFVPKETWADYLQWLRVFLELPVRNLTRAGQLVWQESDNCYAVPLDNLSDGTTEVVYARTVVLATGIDGSGAWQTPGSVTKALPRHLYAHTHAEIDFASFRGKKIGVLGAGACAFDNAAVALEHGAQAVDLFYRRREMVRVNPYRWAEFTGFLKHHADLPDADKWKFIHQLVKMGQLPPASTYERATSFSNFSQHAASPWESVEPIGPGEGTGVRVTTPRSTHEFDFVIAGTGFTTNLALRTELSHLHKHIQLWRDMYQPPQELQNEELARHPYLGAHFEFLPRPGGPAYLSRVFNYTFGCLLSLGFGGASISGMKYSIPRVVSGVTRQLYVEDCDAFFQSLCAFDVREI